jgi:hypothetical protein
MDAHRGLPATLVPSDFKTSHITAIAAKPVQLLRKRYLNTAQAVQPKTLAGVNLPLNDTIPAVLGQKKRRLGRRRIKEGSCRVF